MQEHQHKTVRLPHDTLVKIYEFMQVGPEILEAIGDLLKNLINFFGVYVIFFKYFGA